MFTVFLANSAWSQELHLKSGSNVFITPKAYVHVSSNVVVDAAADLTITSSAANSGSFLVPGASTVTGDITYQRYVSADWRSISVPVTNQSTVDFVADTSNDLLQGSGTGDDQNYSIALYDNGNVKGERWVYHTVNNPLEAGGNFVSGKGYSVRRGTAGVLTFKGTMNTEATATVSLPESESISATLEFGPQLFGMAGNPYPSYLPATNQTVATDNVLAANIALNNLDPNFSSFYFWDGSEYLVVNHADGGAVYLAPGQGFHVDPVAFNTNFVFPEAYQVPQPATSISFLRTAEPLKITLNLFNGISTKTTKLFYLNNTTTGLDVGYDAGRPTEVEHVLAINTHLVSDSEGVNFSLQCLPTTDLETLIVPVSVKAAANQTLTFGTTISNLPIGLKVYLEDKVNNTITNITEASHEVTINTPLDGIGRFYIHTSQNSLSVEDVATVSGAFNMYKTNNTNLRVTGLQENGVALLKMYTTLGKQVLSSSFNVQTVNDIALPNNLAKGIYLVQLVSTGTKETKKIIIE